LPVTGRDTGWENTGAGRDTVERFFVRINGIPFSTGIIPYSSHLRSAGICPTPLSIPLSPTDNRPSPATRYIKASSNPNPPNPTASMHGGAARRPPAAPDMAPRDTEDAAQLRCTLPPPLHRHAASRVAPDTAPRTHRMSRNREGRRSRSRPSACTPRCQSGEALRLGWLLPAPPNKKPSIPPSHSSDRESSSMRRSISGIHLSTGRVVEAFCR
jgi:hypothetical protein